MFNVVPSYLGLSYLGPSYLGGADIGLDVRSTYDTNVYYVIFVPLRDLKMKFGWNHSPRLGDYTSQIGRWLKPDPDLFVELYAPGG